MPSPSYLLSGEKVEEPFPISFCTDSLSAGDVCALGLCEWDFRVLMPLGLTNNSTVLSSLPAFGAVIQLALHVLGSSRNPAASSCQEGALALQARVPLPQLPALVPDSLQELLASVGSRQQLLA